MGDGREGKGGEKGGRERGAHGPGPHDVLHPKTKTALAQRGEAVDIPEYNFVTHSRSELTHRVEPVDVVIVEGILVLHMEAIR